jgi:hypothetical protein
VKSYVEDKLEASGCDYKMGKVEVTDVQRTPEDFANGTSSAQDIKVHFSVKRTTGEFQDTFIIFLLAKDQEFDKSDPRLYAFDVALKTRTHNCIKKGN